MIISVDIETSCAIGCKEKCSHALDSHKNKIDCIGIWCPEWQDVIRGSYIEYFKDVIEKNPNIKFIGQNFKWDLKTLYGNGIKIPLDRWLGDTQLMASIYHHKVPQQWLDNYEVRRREKNKELKVGYRHRQGRKNSLKVLAPYFLGVDPFWENPGVYDNDEYVLKDCKYTYLLHKLFLKVMSKKERKFYLKKLRNWTKLLFKVEMIGVRIDQTELEKQKTEVKEKRNSLRKQLIEMWRIPIDEFRKQEISDLQFKYQQLSIKFLMKKNSVRSVVEQRYAKLFEKACLKIKDFNFDSPKHIKWLLNDFFKLNITTEQFKKESTGVEVLERLAKDRDDIKKYIEYRECEKLLTAFYPRYEERLVNNCLYTNFNPTGTRTGRLSSSEPNLQQVPNELRKLFVPRENYVMIGYDKEAIEAKLIAYYTDDPLLYTLVSQRKDIHGESARIFFDLPCKNEEVKVNYPNERRIAKNIGFAIFYKAGWNRLKAMSIKEGLAWSDEKCKLLVSKFRDNYENVFKFQFDCLDPDLIKQKEIVNLCGRPIYFENSEDVYMKGFNTLIQSSASDLMLEAVNNIQQKQDFGLNLLLLVHDEAVWEVKKKYASQANELIKEELTKKVLTTPYGDIKLTVEGGIRETWKK